MRYSSEFSWIWTREAIVRVNYRPILSSEKVHHIKKAAIARQEKKKSGQDFQVGSRLTFGRNLSSTSTSYCDLGSGILT
jgi:hypothetical protein